MRYLWFEAWATMTVEETMSVMPITHINIYTLSPYSAHAALSCTGPFTHANINSKLSDSLILD